MTLQFVLSCATSRFEGCAGGEGAWCDVALAGAGSDWAGAPWAAMRALKWRSQQHRLSGLTKSR